MLKSLCFVALVGTLAMVIAEEIAVPSPPKPDIYAEWTMIPDEEGKLHMVNVKSALNEPQPFFNVETGVVFELYTAANPQTPHILFPGDVTSLAHSYFNRHHPTRFVVHGWNSKGSLTQSFSNAYFQKGNFNFIAVNWQAGANTINYISARNRVNVVGPHVARMIDFLVTYGHMNLDDCMLIGHSLGGHTVGIAGKRVTTGQLPKIVALDPALPLFNYNDVNGRVARGDARAVEVIISNGGLLGFSTPLGDASFYPNGGSSQPGCGLDIMGSCAHSRAHEFYAESINSPNGFWSWNCRSYDELQRGTCHVVGPQVPMGGEPGNMGAAHGIYYLHTNRNSPFALGLRS